MISSYTFESEIPGEFKSKLENTREKLIHFNEKYKAADLIIRYSSVARDMAIGPLISTEIKLAAIKWKVPLAGYFSYGEIGNNDNEICKFYNQSFTLALLTEKGRITLKGIPCFPVCPWQANYAF